MAITIGNNYTKGSTTTSTNSLTWAHNITEGNNRLLLVVISESRTTTVTSVTYNGVALTLLNSGVNGENNTMLYYLKNPEVGTFNIVLTMSASLQHRAAGSIDLKGVDLINSFGNGVALTGYTGTSNYNVSMASTVANSLFIETHADSGTVNNPGSGQIIYAISDNRLGAYKFITTVGTQTLNWIVGNGANNGYTHLINEILPAPEENGNFLMFF